MAKWALVGGLGIVVQLALLAGLSGAGLSDALATFLAVGGAIVHNFVWHDRWTWADRPAAGMRDRALRFARFSGLTAVASLVGTVLLTVFFVERIGAPLLVANVLAVVSVSLLNLLSAHHLVFVPSRGDHPIRVRRAVVWAALATPLAIQPAVTAAELQPATLAAWERYVRAAEARIEREASPSREFLWPVDRRALRRGSIEVSEMELETAGDHVPGGLIHHWRGAVFITGVTLDQVLEELQSPDGTRHLQEDVLAWKMLTGDASRARIFLKLVRKEIVTVTYNTEHDVRYWRHGASRASSRSTSVKIAELQDANTTAEREKPVGQDRGFLWRLNSYWRYEQVPGGVIVQVESLTLSRQVPALVRPLIRPLIDRIARESMVRTLEAVRRRFRAVSATQANAESR